MASLTRALLASAFAFALGACGRVTPGPEDGGGAAGCADLAQTSCGGMCVFLDSDLGHCGACGTACGEGRGCVDGACVCAIGRIECGAACADPASDPAHCGACGTACPLDWVCDRGACALHCSDGLTECGGGCVDLDDDALHCGGCARACEGGRVCVARSCRCPSGHEVCDGTCRDVASDPSNCGGCGRQCFGGWECRGGACACPQDTTECGTDCADLATDERNCGACGVFCHPAQTCEGRVCVTPCPTGWANCGGECVNTDVDPLHCGGCANPCGTLSCLGGNCQACSGAHTDCDSDGWTGADGDCCDQPGPGCGARPALINPGAVDLPGNSRDDNCDGLVDAADPDNQPCDANLASDTTDPAEFARALGICRVAEETPASPAQRTWGLLDGRLLLADGSAIVFPGAHSVRANFGALLQPLEGARMVVLSSGIASDATQQNPGPNGGPQNTSIQHSQQSVNIQTCSSPYCVSDWFAAARQPVKLAHQLPQAPGCGTLGAPGIHAAFDSVMLVLRLRAPTNVRAFELRGYFFSSEFPESVCSTFNDQLIALVDTPGGSPVGAVNPTDKNLFTWFEGGKYWPVGVNVASGTDLFKVCQPQQANAACWDSDVSASSCAWGTNELLDTGFDSPATGGCTNGGATGWLTSRGNVRAGEIVELRIALWDVADHLRDSLALFDAFRWIPGPVAPGTED